MSFEKNSVLSFLFCHVKKWRLMAYLINDFVPSPYVNKGLKSYCVKSLVQNAENVSKNVIKASHGPS